MRSARNCAAISSQRWQPSRLYSLALVSKTRDGDERGALAAPHLERDDGVLVEAGEELVELLHGFQFRVLALVHHGEKHVALAYVRLRIRAHVRNDDAVRHAERLPLLGRKLPDHDAEAVSRRFGLRLG